MKTEFMVLKAHHGDSILIKTFDIHANPFTILIDGGTSKTYDKPLRQELKKLKKIDLLVLTHIDADHIKGLLKFVDSPFFSDIEIVKYWFNSKNISFIRNSEKISYGQAISLEKLLISKKEVENKWSDEILSGQTIILAEGIYADIISPTQPVLDKLYKDWHTLPEEFYKQEIDVNVSSTPISQLSKGKLEDLALHDFKPDKAHMADIFNTSSIAFHLVMPDLKILLLGDARPEIYVETLKLKYSVENPLVTDYVKISHHGSMNNTTVDLLELLDCEKYIISTNGGSGDHRLPDRETIARIIHNPSRVAKKYPKKRTIFFNYPKEEIELKAGKLIDKSADFKTGNWEFMDNVNSFPN